MISQPEITSTRFSLVPTSQLTLFESGLAWRVVGSSVFKYGRQARSFGAPYQRL
jgi:hypothetical protein